jgi:hypothetical protein
MEQRLLLDEQDDEVDDGNDVFGSFLSSSFLGISRGSLTSAKQGLPPPSVDGLIILLGSSCFLGLLLLAGVLLASDDCMPAM